MLKFFQNKKQSKIHQYKILGMVPIKDNNKIYYVYPKVENYVEEKEDTKTIVYKKYKNKYILSSEYLDENFESKKYLEVFSDTPILNSSTIIYEDINEIFDIGNTDIDSLKDSEYVKYLKTLYNPNKIDNILEELIVNAQEEFTKHAINEDYDYDECLNIVINDKLDLLFEDVLTNIENIYIVQSLIYYSFSKLYYELYCYSKKQ